MEIPDEVNHPIVVERGNTGSVVLNCDYDVTEEGEKAQLEIKWYFNDEPAPFYIWVPSGGRKPQLIGSEFENHVDLEYVANEVNLNEEPYFHKILKLIKIFSAFEKCYI